MKKVERQERRPAFINLALRRLSHARGLAAIAALSLLPSCASSPGTEAPPPGPGSGENPAVKSFLKIGSRPISAAVQAESFIASRCLFLDGEVLTHVSLQAPVRQAPADARAELSALLGALERRRTGADTDSNERTVTSSPIRVYQLQPSSDWIIDLSLEEFPNEPARVRAICDLRNKGEKEIVITSSAPLLLEFLRQQASRSLLAQMHRPRIPLDQHFQALAGFLGTGALSEAELKRARRLLITKAGTSGKSTALVSTLLDHLGSFDERDLAALDSGSDIAPRVFYLAWSANRGFKKPLGELLVLSLEYHGEAVLFQRALSALFPAARNKRLYALHPTGKDREGALAFIRALRQNIAKASYLRGEGWVLEP